MTRRDTLLALATPVAAAFANGAPLPSHKLNVVCVGGHPDDPGTVCGGTLAPPSHAVITSRSSDLTRGEAGIDGKTHEGATRIGSDEAMSACRVLGAKPT